MTLHVAQRPSTQLPSLSEEELFARLAGGGFENIVICTGAGVSTAAGIPDFRSPGGLFKEIGATFGTRFPEALINPEAILSRSFASRHQHVWQHEVEPWLRSQKFEDAMPTATHRFCAWLHRRGWLRRIYTQNVDGLHLRPELAIPLEMVMECHGALRDGSIVLYGDDLPRRFEGCCSEDFSCRGPQVDLVLVLGTSLQVAPFCGLPNLAPRGCTRVLVNLDLADCLTNSWSQSRMADNEYYGLAGSLGGLPSCRPQTTTRIGSRKDVPLQPLWRDRKAGKRWPQMLVETSCDSFVARFFDSRVAQARRLVVDE